MTRARWIAGLALGAITAAGIAVSPALHAQGADVPSTFNDPRLGAFTPAAADPKLAATLARSGIDPSEFRFTPTESKQEGRRSVTVAVRASTERSATPDTKHAAATSPSLTLAPIAYNLGVSVGWKRFALTGDIAKLDMAGQPGSHESTEVGVTYTGKKFAGRVSAASQKPLRSDAPQIMDESNYSIDVGGAYKLTHNLDVTAGVRYKSEKDRLPQLADDRRDSQAVYIGTAFRF
ncbi:hypothetical protein GCM10023219_23060 [Stakelama sediminis]|uniref:Porin domain-containing protein n=1 Tax=Stakelama sediminis TaxID=463200 RepID=A0A840YZL5_9SPHN|nr:porin [Stakelama sediminis]MBB5719261.1 hypothetical protein [Stakelama sediminis]